METMTKDIRPHDHNLLNPTWIKALDQIGIGILVYGQDGSLQYASDRARQTFASVPGESSKGHINDFSNFSALLFDRALSQDHIPDHLHLFLLRRDLGPDVFSELVQTADNRIAQVSVAPMERSQCLVTIRTFNHQIASQRAGTQDLSWQNHVLLQAIEQGQTGIMLFDPKAETQPILFVNRAFCDVYHVNRQNVLGSNWLDLVPELRDHAQYTVIQRIHNNVTSYYGCQVSLTDDLGILFMTDITLLQEKEEQVRHMQRLDSLGQLAGGVAHDFNNVLAIIRGYTQLLQRQMQDIAPDARIKLDHILKACLRGVSLTDKLLTFGRRRTQSNELMDASQSLMHLRDMLMPLLPANITLAIDIPHGLNALKCHEDHFSQIIMNLVLNARDAMKNGGIISITGRTIKGSQIDIEHTKKIPDGQFLRLRIRDQGSGMSEAIMKRIFEPFFTTKAQGQGTGLGLSMVFGLTQQNHGFITVESELERGTTFDLYLPLGDVPPPGATQEDESTTQKISHDSLPLHGLRIMVADDEIDLRDSLCSFLRHCGAEAIQAHDGNDALAIQDSYPKPIDVLLSDVSMPGIDGCRLAALWREVRPETTIILMSGYPQEDKGEAHWSAMLAKPVDYDDLVTYILRLTQKHGYTQPTTQRVWTT